MKKATLSASQSLLAASLALLLAFAPAVATALPLGIANLEIWFDASDSTTLFSDLGVTQTPNGGSVQQWNDKSGNNYHAVADTGTFPVRDDTELNGRPAVEFSDTQSLNINDAFQATSSYTFFVVDEYTGLGTNRRSVQSRNINWLIGKWNGGNRFFQGTFVDGNADGIQAATNNVPVIGAAISDSGAAASFYQRNGADVTNGTPNAGGDPLRLEIGLNGGETSGFAISDLIGYSRALNAAEIIIVENYLSAKNEIPLNTGLGATDVYSGDTPINGDYDFDVFGAGRVDSSNELLASSSAGLEIDASGGSLGDGEFVMAGHKTAANSLTSADVPVGEQRWERVWFLDQTGSVDTTLTFDWSESGLIAPFNAGFNTLYYSPTDPFSFTSVALGTVVDDQFIFNLTGDQLLSGYYTIGTAPPIPEPSTFMLLGLGVVATAASHRRRRKMLRTT